MITKLFLKLTDYPFFRRLIWKPVYEVLAKKFKVKDWCFMNYGYTPSANENSLDLDNSDEINRYPIQLYHYLAAKVNVASGEILEVGSGRGGGAAYIFRYLHPKQITGLDVAAAAVKLANEYFAGEKIQFVQGSAEKLPFADENFDVVINVESSHTYASVAKFLSEVKRVLREGGYFLCADIRVSSSIDLFRQQLRSCGMEVISEENISENVIRAIELEEPIKQKRIRENIPRWAQKIFKEFAGTTDSKAHRELISGELVYYRSVLKKL